MFVSKRFPTSSLLLFFVLLCCCCVTFVVTSIYASKEEEKCSILTPTAALLTRNGGAILTLTAELPQPINTEGSHDLCLSWCSYDQWRDCLQSENQTQDCKCSDPSSSVEESVSFTALQESLFGAGVSQQQTTSTTSSSENEKNKNDKNKNEKKEPSSSSSSSSCAVVSQRWIQNENFGAELKKFHEDNDKLIKENNQKITSASQLQRLLNEKLHHLHAEIVINTTDNVDIFMKNVQTMNQKISELTESIAKRQEENNKLHQKNTRPNLNNNLGRMMKIQIVCASAVTKFPLKNLSAQVLINDAGWQQRHTLVLSTGEGKTSQVAISSKIVQKTWLEDIHNVSISLRAGAPGEDSTTTEKPPSDLPLAPWILSLSNNPTISRVGNAQQAYGNARKKSMKMKSFEEKQQEQEQNSYFNIYQRQQQQEKEGSKQHQGAVPNQGELVDDDAERPNVFYTRTSQTLSPTTTYGAESDEEVMFEDSTGATSSSRLPGDAGAGGEGAETLEFFTEHAKTEMLSGFTEETKIPHLISLTRKAVTVVEVGTAPVSARLVRIVAAFRCRKYAEKVCQLPVFLRVNISNPNSYSVLGANTQLVVDGVPFKYKNNEREKFQPPVAPKSWGFVDLGEDNRIRVTRVEKGNVLSGKKENIFYSTFFGGEEKRVSKQQFDIRVTNTRREDVTVDVLDQLPRSNTDKIEIIVDEETLKSPHLVTKSIASLSSSSSSSNSNSNSHSEEQQQQQENATNYCAALTLDKKRCIATKASGDKIRFSVTVKAGSTISLPLSYSVIFPKDKFVAGI